MGQFHYTLLHNTSYKPYSNEKILIDMLMNVLHYNLLFLLIEHPVLALTSSYNKEPVKNLYTSDILLILKELEHWEKDLQICCDTFCRILSLCRF